jgi:hypothetical protein
MHYSAQKPILTTIFFVFCTANLKMLQPKGCQQ